ncbi:MAG: hypothetical protein ACE5DR_07075, partial [Thermodesulfobacteriota bacterium]
IAASIFLYSRFISPLKILESDALDMASGGDVNRGFEESMDGVVGSLASQLNTILESKEQLARSLEADISRLKTSVENKDKAIRFFEEFCKSSGRAYESEALLGGAISDVPELTGASRALIYIFENNELTLKCSAPDDEALSAGASILPAELRGDGNGELLDISGPVGEDYPEAIRRHDVKWLRSFAIGSEDNDGYGRLILLYESRPDRDEVEFISAFASAIGTSISFVQRLKEEHDNWKNCFMLLNQLPFAVAVFEKGGACILVNLLLKKFLGSAPGFDFLKDYTFMEDDVLYTQGLVTTIKKSYDGFITEFIINYDPYLVKRYGFMGESRDLRVKSIPLYDPDGTISKIALLFEDIGEHDEPRPPEDKTS